MSGVPAVPDNSCANPWLFGNVETPFRIEQDLRGDYQSNSPPSGLAVM